jgi:hypothetical protein
MKQAPNSHQHHDLYRKYRHPNRKISGLLGECGVMTIGFCPIAVVRGERGEIPA